MLNHHRSVVKFQLAGISAVSSAMLRLLLVGILLIPASAAGTVRRISSPAEVDVSDDKLIPEVAKETMKEMQNLTLSEALEIPENERVLGSPENQNGVHTMPCNP